MTRKEPMKVGNVYGLNDDSLAMVVEVYPWRNPLSGDLETAARLLVQDGTEHHCPVFELREYHPYYGLPKRTFQKRLANGLWHERFQVEDGPAFANTSAGYATLPESRVAAWRATYAPPPAPEPEPQVDHRLTRNERLEAARAAFREWMRSPDAALFYSRVWGEMERIATPQGGEYFTEATAREVREYLRANGGWAAVKQRLETA